VGGVAVKYNVYLRETDILLRFNSSDRDYVELAARLLKLAGVTAEVKREGSRDVWYVYAYTDVLAAAHKELRNAIANIVRKAVEIVNEGKERGSLTLKGFEKRVEVGGKEHVVKVIDGGAVEEDRGGRKLLRIRITAEVDGVKSEYTITFTRRGSGSGAKGRAYARADAPGGRETDAERFSALIKALTGKEPWIQRMKDGRIMMACGREHLDGFARYAELADAIENWLERSD